LALSGCTGEPASDCAAQLAEDQAKVRTNREWTEQDLPGLGGYTAVHWQARAAGNPCSRAPGPTDWRYQGVLLLTREDAGELAGRFDWREVAASPSPDLLDAPAEMWPALVPFVPDGVRWLHSDEYAQTT